MELDDFKATWQSLDRRLAEQNALNQYMIKEGKVTQAKSMLRPLIFGQVVQLIAGIVMNMLFAPFWVAHINTPHLLICGLALHGYGLMFIILAGRELYAINQIDYAAPVLEIQKQLANLRSWRIRIAPIFGITGSVIWIPLMLVIFYGLGADIWQNDPNVVYWFITSALVSLAIVFGLLYWSRQPRRIDAAQASDAGQSIQRAQRLLAEAARFEQV